ncbi:MAG: SOS response-associated peptidase family protein, partial [Desulfatirhabdiaceae bacterium]
MNKSPYCREQSKEFGRNSWYSTQKNTFGKGEDSMCGRFTLSANLGTFMDEFHLHVGIPDYSPRYNIAPGQNILVITEGPGARELSQMRWGLI